MSQDWHDSDPCSSSEGTLPCHLARRTGQHQALGMASASRHPSNSCNSWAMRGCFKGPATKLHWRSFVDSQPCPPHGPAICPAGQARLDAAIMQVSLQTQHAICDHGSLANGGPTPKEDSAGHGFAQQSANVVLGHGKHCSWPALLTMP